jgi:outer membrane lipoprotein-sorting protein
MLNRCTILALGFLTAVLAPAASAQDKDAEKLFRDMEKKIKDAKAFEIVFTYEIAGKAAKGSLLLARDDKARLKVSGRYYPGVEKNSTFELVSDGKRYQTKGANLGIASNGVPYIDPDGKGSAGDTGKGFHAMGLVAVSRGSVGYLVYGLPYWVQGGEVDPDKEDSRMTVYDFKAAAAEKVGDRQAKVIHYRFGKGGKGDAEITLWLDAQTNLPLKRVFNNPTGVFEVRITETYSEFNLNPKIEGKTFELPK